MNLEFSEQCLFCLHSLQNGPLPKTSQNSGQGISISDFQEFCSLLKINPEAGEGSLKWKQVVRELISDRENCLEALVCSGCLEIVRGLKRLNEEMRRLQKRMDFGIRSIQQVIRRSEQRELVGGTSSSSVEADYREFVTNFRKMVKEVETEKLEPVVLSEEAQALSQIYEKMDQDVKVEETESQQEGEENEEMNLNSLESVQIKEEIGNQNFISFQEDDDSNLVNILSSVDVDLKEEEEELSQTDSSNDGMLIVEEATPSPSTSTVSSTAAKKCKIAILCRFCSLRFNSVVSYYRHRKSEHPQESKALLIPYLESNSSLASSQIFTFCSICGELKNSSKATLVSFSEHMLSHENVASHIITTSSTDPLPPEHQRPFACDWDQCDQRFCLEVNLELHKICYHESTLMLLRCEVCKVTGFKTWEHLVNHLVDRHGSRTIHSCKKCSMAFMTADKVLEHMRVHAPSNRLPCPECPAVSPSLKELYQHWNECHPNLLTSLKCTICQETFIMPSTYRSHMSSMHQNNQEVVLNITKNPEVVFARVHPPPSTPQQQQNGEPLPFATNRPFTITLVEEPASQTNGTSPVTCPHCRDGRTFKNRVTLENHIRIHHDTTVPKHRCDQCDKSFVHRSTLRYHIQQVHLGIRYKCPHCPKSFTAKSLLKGHLKLHSGEGPPVLDCKVCGKVFSSLTALKAHISTQHQPKKPVQCDICGREFQNLYSLRGHKSDAHNLKPYGCPHCPQRFSRVKRFEEHVRQHEAQEMRRRQVMMEGDHGLGIKIVAVGSVSMQ